MRCVRRRRPPAALIALIVIAAVSNARVAVAQVRPPVPGQPFQYWDVLEVDGGARKIYFRNDLTTPITISEVTIQRCENTRQLCGTYPSNLVVPPGKTVVAFKVERYDSKLGWSTAYTFRTRGVAQPVSGPPIVLPPGAVQMQQVPVDSIAGLVPPLTENGSCGRVSVPDLPAGHRALMMVFGPATQPTARMVMVRVDASGNAYEYQDIRSQPGDTAADPHRSQIRIDLIRQTATVRNSGGGQVRSYFTSGPKVTTAQELGNPGEIVAKIVKECGS